MRACKKNNPVKYNTVISDHLLGPSTGSPGPNQPTHPVPAANASLSLKMAKLAKLADVFSTNFYSHFWANQVVVCQWIYWLETEESAAQYFRGDPLQNRRNFQSANCRNPKALGSWSFGYPFTNLPKYLFRTGDNTTYFCQKVTAL